MLTIQELLTEFGDFYKYLGDDGKPSPEWELSILTKIPLPKPLPLAWDSKAMVSTTKVHKRIASHLSSALYDAYSIPEIWSTINDYGGVYEFRRQRNSTSTLSTHCWGISIDLDVGDNPFGKEPKVHPGLVTIFRDHGFSWGGNFKRKRKDGMHFEFTDLGKL